MSGLSDEVLHFTGSLHCNGSLCEVPKQILTELASKIIKLEDELQLVISPQPEREKYYLARIAELEAQLAELRAENERLEKQNSLS